MAQTKPAESSTDIYDWQEKRGKMRFRIIVTIVTLVLAIAASIAVLNK